MRDRVQAISVKADLTGREAGQVKRSGRSQNRLHTQKALLEYLVLGRVEQP
jgi:hypothetical protein